MKLCHVVAALLFLISAQPVRMETVAYPESLHRRAWLPFPQERLMQRMLLEATVKHSLPVTHACSSLEGPMCLYGSSIQPAVARDILAETALEAVSKAAQRKVKVVMLRPDGSTDMKVAIKKYLTTEQTSKMKPAEPSSSNPGQDSTAGAEGEVIYEGTSEGLADLEGLAQRMLRASGLPQSAAASLQTQLARAITNVEFDKDEPVQQPKEAEPAGRNDQGKTSGATDQSAVDSGEHARLDSDDGGAVSDNAAATHSSSTSPEAIAAMTHEELSALFNNVLGAVKVLQQRQPFTGTPQATPDGQYTTQQAREDPSQQQQQQQEDYHAQQTQRSSQQHAWRDSPKPDVTGAERITKQPRQSMLSRARTEQDTEAEEVDMDLARSGTSEQAGMKTATDGSSSSDQPLRLPDDRSWLSGLNDAEYDAYWDNYYSEQERSAEVQDGNNPPPGLASNNVLEQH